MVGRALAPRPAHSLLVFSAVADLAYFRYPNLQPWFDTLQPAEHVGAYRLYYVPPGSLPRR